VLQDVQTHFNSIRVQAWNSQHQLIIFRFITLRRYGSAEWGSQRTVNLFARIFCKLVEIVLHARTLIIHGTQVLKDPTWLLVKYQSEAQLNASAQLAAELGLAHGQLKVADLMTRVEEFRMRKKSQGQILSLAVIIPFRDSWKMTRDCLESLLKQNLEHIALTICLVDNGSQKEETQLGIDSLKADWDYKFPHNSAQPPTLRILRDNRPFNFSELNNAAVEFLTQPENGSAPEYLLFLNNDTLFEDPDSLERLLFFSSLSPRMGAVGCTLLYRNSNVQHLFLAPGVKLAGAHPAKGIGLNANHAWYADPHPVPAITGALLLLSTKHFTAAKGFDTTLATSCQDLDLCLKLQNFGLENWVLPNVFVKHFETSTRLKQNQATEITYVCSKWGARLAMNAYYSRELTRWSERPALSWGESAYPWSAVLEL